MKLLILDLDTLRPDHLGCYGYHRNTSPNIDSIAQDGVTFNKYYCPNAPCLPSRASLITGMYGIANGIVGHDGSTADLRIDPKQRSFTNQMSHDSLFSLLKKSGMHTASISTFPERHSAWWFNAGLNEWHNVNGCGVETADDVTPTAIDWLEKNAVEKEDWALHINYWDAHTPYRVPADFRDEFSNDPLPSWLDDEKILQEHLKKVGPHGLNEINMWNDDTNKQYPNHLGKVTNMKELRQFIDGYDCGIKYMDMHLGKIFDVLKKLNIYEEVCIIITSDHGENFGELGIYGEHATADESTCRIPMIIKWNHGVKGFVDHSWRTNVDLLPTLADLLNMKHSKNWDGDSFSKVLTDGIEVHSRDNVVLTQCAHVIQRSVRFDHYLYIKTLHSGYHLFDDEMLFDLSSDPYEQTNIAENHPDLCVKGEGIIKQWESKYMKKHGLTVDPMMVALKEKPCHCRGQLPDYLERLNNTGRSEGAKHLSEKFRHELNA